MGGSSICIPTHKFPDQLRFEDLSRSLLSDPRVIKLELVCRSVWPSAEEIVLLYNLISDSDIAGLLSFIRLTITSR